MRTEIMLAIPMCIFKKDYKWIKEYSKITLTLSDKRLEQCLEIPLWKADRILNGCGINPGVIHFKLTTEKAGAGDPMLFYADVARYEKLKHEFVNFCGGSSTDEETERLQTELLRTNGAIAKIQEKSENDEDFDDSDLDRRIRYKNVLEKRLCTIGASQPVSYVGMFNDILTHEDTESLQIQNDNLIVQTKPIIIHYENKDYLIGKFAITIPKTNSDVLVKNLDRQVNGKHHPHIPGTEQPCWGDAKDSIKACYDNRNYYGLVLLALCLLNGYYHTGAYVDAKIEQWS